MASTMLGDHNELQPVVFRGMCDASGAIPLSSNVFAVADDEDNVLRIYDAEKGGYPINEVDISSSLNLHRIPKKRKQGFKKPPETDMEAATRSGDLAFWITSHGLNASGKLHRARFHFLATDIKQEIQSWTMNVVGFPYTTLMHDLIADPRFSSLQIEKALTKAPKEPGGLNIEGMTKKTDGGVFIGFRNPIPDGLAVIILMENPEEVIRGAAPVFADPIRLNLGGLGVRSLSRYGDFYLIIAGHYNDKAGSVLYLWDGEEQLNKVESVSFAGLNPEGFFTPNNSDKFMVLSDDGSLIIDDVPCKKLKDKNKKAFRGVWLTDVPYI